jgi:hypothetical protein
MLTLLDELVAPLRLDDRYRAAEARHLRAVLPRSPGFSNRVAGAAGRLLVTGGARLQALAERRGTGRPWSLSADLCPECGS